MNKWLYQYLTEENLYYLSEHHPEDGVLGEDCFETFTELEKYVKDNNIPIRLGENRNITNITYTGEPFFSELKTGKLSIDLYAGSGKTRFRSQHMLTFEAIRHAPSEALGDTLKRILIDLETYIKKHENGK